MSLAITYNIKSAHFRLLLSLSAPLIFSIGVPQTSHAGVCTSSFAAAKHTGDFSQVPSATEAPLPPQFIAAVQKWITKAQAVMVERTHRAPPGSHFDNFKETIKIGDGEGFVIGISHLEAGKDPLHVGEHIAASFVAKIVRILYPNAIIEHFTNEDLNLPNAYGAYDAFARWRNKHWDKNFAFLDIHDTSETMLHFERAPLRMKFIKPANPGLAGLPHKSLRESFGIPTHHTVLSFYFKYPEGEAGHYNEAPSMAVMAKSLIDRYSKFGKRVPDVIFASRGGGKGMSATEAFGESFLDYEVIQLSEWAQKYDPTKKFIVINNTKGRMPHILNISDLAVVSGPINIMEPLSAGTPLLFINNPSVIVEYKGEDFDAIANQAMRTAGAWQMRSMEDLDIYFAQAISKPSSQIIPPFLLTNKNTNDTPVDQLVHEIISTINNSMKIVENVKANPPEKPRYR